MSNTFLANTLKHHYKNLLIIIALMLGTYSLQAQSGTMSADESEIKAAYLYKFLNHVDWTNNAIDSFRVAIVGNTATYAAIKTISDVYKVKEKTISVYYYATTAKFLSDPYAAKMQMVYLGNATGQDLVRKASNSRLRNALLVSDSDNFVDQGGHVNFYTDHNKVKFKMNPALMQSDFFKVKAPLLRIGLAAN